MSLFLKSGVSPIGRTSLKSFSISKFSDASSRLSRDLASSSSTAV
jgi:hypothetical protein